MKEAILQEAAKGSTPTLRARALRESLQHLILKILSEQNAFNDLSFLGGTALRLLFGVRRFSEDLDFSTISQQPDFPFENLVEKVRSSIQELGFTVDAKPKKMNAVCSTFFRFGDLSHLIDPNSPKDQKIHIKFEVDIRPPEGARSRFGVITGPFLYRVRHHDLPSLFAGKLHAIMFRGFVKGRDLYDFLWFHGRHTLVNGVLLQNAITQTEEREVSLTSSSLQERLKKTFSEMDFKKAAEDVRPFLVDTSELDLFDRDTFLELAQAIELEG